MIQQADAAPKINMERAFEPPLGYQDSNLEWMNQNHLCCQLHHTPVFARLGTRTSLSSGR